MESDRKSGSLQQLYSHMWREAYKTKAVMSEIYEDVVPCIQDWLAQDMKVYVFTSDSVESQKLLFGFSDKGDLVELFSGFYDSEIGATTEKDSFKAIADKTGIAAGEFLYLTDMPKEAAAAVAAGMKTSLVVREGNAPLSEDDLQRYNIVATFDELACDLDEEDFPSKEARTEENGDEDEEEDEDEERGGGGGGGLGC
ncbi:hypothetical protein CAPTEDRAFT_226906 [Capitella teleta]|uniref:Enolase-phosphatase E1 n=1 Tax=Capitella teleta TaxID=283909 RepID=R7TMI5_CAPTE|nr:hypothetical protein CAPTEDRAFT_226906 [Capitella teleta]|eukprot:ELT94834.1 hypothetical protein CAPTEDRAFT_226906 [Capitella teleta]